MSFGTKNLACPIKGGIMSIMSMGGEGGGEGWRIYGGATFFPEPQKGVMFSPDSRRHAISVLRGLTKILDRSCSKVLFFNN